MNYTTSSSPCIEVDIHESFKGKYKKTYAERTGTRSNLFKGWIMLSSGIITIHLIRTNKTCCVILRIVIYPMDIAIYPLNNWAQVLFLVDVQLNIDRLGIFFDSKELVLVIEFTFVFKISSSPKNETLYFSRHGL